MGKFCKLNWHPSGDFLAFPGLNGDIKVASKDTWEIVYSLKSGHKEMVSILKWSPNGLYLLSTGYDDQILVWDITTRESIIKTKSSCLVSDISWSPCENSIAWIDIEGMYGVRESIIPSHMSNPYANPSSKVNEPTKTSMSSLKTPTKSSKKVDDYDADEEALLLASKTKMKRLKKTTPSNKSVAATKAKYGLLMDSDNEDEGNISLEEEVNGMNNYDYYQTPTVPTAPPSKNSEQVNYTTPPQPSFHPGSTPLHSGIGGVASIKRNFLTWNCVGSIISRDDEVHSSVEIDFSDKSHRTIRFTDHYNFYIAALGKHGAVFGSRSTGDKEKKDENKYL